MNTTILENHRGMTNVHPLASLPFRSRPQQDLKPIYFPGGETKKIEDVIVTTDVGTDPNRIQHIASVKAFFDKNKDDKFSPFDDVFGYNIELYFSKDAIKLDKAFKEVEADEKGMIFFIEDNTDDISAQFCKIKIGRRVKDNLTDISQLYNSKSVYEYINSFVAIDRELFQELIIHGKLENVALEAVEFLFTAGNYFNPLAISKPIVEGLGTICHHISSFIDKGRLDDYRWNPNAKKIKEDGTEDTEHKFEPFLFPFIEGYLDQMDDSKINEYAIQSFKEFKSGFLEYDTSIRSYIKKTDFGKLLETNIPIPIGVFSSVTVPVEIDIIPDSAEAFLYSKYIQVSDAIINKLNDLETFDFTDLIKKGIRVANAFLCGIWNGLIDAVSGIFQLFEMVFKGVVAMVDFTDNFSTQFPILMEYIDNAIDAIKNIDFNLLYTHFKTKIKDATQSFETIAYFSGAFIGFIVGLVIEIVGGLLISGGTLSVAAVLEKLASLFTSVLKGIAKAGKKVFDFSKKLVINTFKGFRKLLDQLIEFLRKGTKGFKDMIDDLFDKVKKTIKPKKYGKVTRAIIKKEMPKDFLKAIKKLGFKENDILDYFMRYHNENEFKFLNEIDGLITKYPELSKTDIYALWSYTTNLYYGNLNRWLRTGKNRFKTKEISKIITSALEKMPKYNGNAFRALEFSEQSLLLDFLKKHKKGKTVNYKEFVSCGSNTKAAFFDKSKKNVFLKLEVKGAPIISDFADGIKIRGYAKEELLLLQNRKFKVTNYKEVNGDHFFELIEK